MFFTFSTDKEVSHHWMKKVDREERGDVFTTQPWLGSQQMNGTGLAGLGTGRGGERCSPQPWLGSWQSTGHHPVMSHP
jgi:hypothetical protein